jgi:hypothetical protein
MAMWMTSHAWSLHTPIRRDKIGDDGLTDGERSEAAERWRSGPAARPVGRDLEALKKRLSDR